MLIRSFEPSDAEALNAVALAAFEQYRGVYSDWETLSRGVGSMAALSEGGEIVVAEDGAGTIVGGVAYFGPGAGPRADFFEPHWPIVRMLVVDPDARGKGIGGQLTEECIARARRDGADVVALHTSPAMEVALAMYLKMGFALERKVPDRMGVPYGLYLMQLASGTA
jgi:GNAT superfamily N-acetyltransferase